MRLITDVQDDAQFLGAVYDAAEAVANMVKAVSFTENRKNMPEQKRTKNEA